MIDLNRFVPPGSGVQLTEPSAISDRGEVATNGFLNGNLHAFVLIPCGGDDQGCQGENPTAVTQNSPAAATQQPTAATPANRALSDGASRMLDRLRGRRFPGLRTLGPGTGPAN